ncbi:APC family permease [Mediterraneibacter sp. NSJ-55]|uniref:APC family permease n=1 Tax=Mediterraneibacter hominis TaxID=2763054 RepID=A0A923LJX5_9FIRM|nr:APC family permease [Mediterraneibacter hominis]MBC5689614.1 APC family permease [Mediterraneibacter hominis]
MGEKKELKRVLGKFDLFAIGFGAIIGWGWISMGSTWIGGAGMLGACLAFVFAGLMMIFVALCYGELASAMPKAGGPQNFAWMAYGTKASFIAGWACLLNPVLFVSWLCNAAVDALNYLYPLSDTPLLYTVYGYEIHTGTLAAYMIMAVMMIWLTYTGIQGMSRVQNIAVIIMIIIAAIFIIAALFKGDTRNFEPLIANGAKGVAANILTCATFLAGFECIPQASEESVVKPRELGKVIVFVMLAAVGWFILTIVATSLGLSHGEIQNSKLAAVDSMAAIFNNNPLAGKAMIVVGLLGILTSWISTYINGSRLMYSMSRGGMIPEFFAKLHSRYQTPYRTILIMGAVMLASGFLGGGVNVWYPTAAGFGSVVAYVIVALSFIKLRKSKPDMPRPYKVKSAAVGYIAVLMGCILVGISLPGFPGSGLKWPYEILMVIIWIALGGILYIRAKNKPDGLKKIDTMMSSVLKE